MTKVIRCLITFTATSCLSVCIHFLLPAKSIASHAIDQIECGLVGLSKVPVKSDNRSSATSNSRISQEEIVRFPQIGAVRVRANEEVGRDLTLTFINQKSENEIQSYDFGSYWNWSKDTTDGDWHPKIRFKGISIRGLPNPLVIGIAMDPGVSDSAWQAVAFGVVDGQLQLLTFEKMETSNEGGFFFGDLGKGLGLGAAQWDFVWGEEEGHPPPHKYEVRLSKWNGRRFEWEKVIRTRGRYNSPQKA